MFVPKIFFWIVTVTVISALRMDTPGLRKQSKQRVLQQVRDEAKSVGRSETPINFLEDKQRLLRQERDSTTALFVHARQMLEALQNGDNKFHVVEENDDVSTWNGNDMNEVASRAIYETRTSYEMATDKIVVLDHMIDADRHGEIRALSDTHVLHCGRSLRSDAMAPGTILLGTQSGAWSGGDRVARYLNEMLSTYHPDHATVKQKDGFLVIRRVTEVKRSSEDADHDADQECLHVHTEDVHPIELFSKFRVSSVGSIPVNHNYGQVMAKNDGTAVPAADTTVAKTADRQLFSRFATPISVYHCTDPRFGLFNDDKYALIAGFKAQKIVSPTISSDYKQILDNDDKFDTFAALSTTNGGCLEYSTDFRYVPMYLYWQTGGGCTGC